jgi:hypothetical protein
MSSLHMFRGTSLHREINHRVQTLCDCHILVMSSQKQALRKAIATTLRRLSSAELDHQCNHPMSFSCRQFTSMQPRPSQLVFLLFQPFSRPMRLAVTSVCPLLRHAPPSLSTTSFNQVSHPSLVHAYTNLPKGSASLSQRFNQPKARWTFSVSTPLQT